MIRIATREDAPQVAVIYNYYVVNTIVTFEEEPVSDAEVAERILLNQSHGVWLVSEKEGEILGYSYAAPFASRCAYRSTAETTIYISQSHQRQGHGIALYNSLLEHLRNSTWHCAIGLITLPNEGSITLHEKLGFIKVGELSEVGWKFGNWINVGYWQLIF